ncbi:hypothetical protein [Gemmata sp.]|uniref:hypothetical protein n=1 Tax=Gemmata sp. TaxID=1914242 RepID=UPI003F702722
MTEAEWLACGEPQRLVGSRRSRITDRKARLYACACCRSMWHLLTDERSRRAVETAERFADDQADGNELTNAAVSAREARQAALQASNAGREPLGETFTHAAWAAWVTAHEVLAATDALPAFLSACSLASRRPAAGLGGRAQFKSMCADIFRDIFGNPFRPVTFDPAWRTSTAVAIARGMYESRNFDAMPILADALQDAGCEDEAVLTHCREASLAHVRGCWVADLVLGKS